MCAICSYAGHMSNSCTFQQVHKQCHKCRKRGHLASEECCPKHDLHHRYLRGEELSVFSDALQREMEEAFRDAA